MTRNFTREDADALRDSADILRDRALNPARKTHEMTHLAMTAAELDREAGRIEDELAVRARKASGQPEDSPMR